MAETVLAVHGLWAAYGATPILQGVEMTINRGEIVGVIGRNGAGKTTLMRCLIGLIRATRGSIAMGVFILPGRMAFARRLYLALAAARFSVRAMTAVFVVL